MKAVIAHLALAASVLASSGCGMNDYLSRMDAQRARIQEIDEINGLLDAPIEMPTMKIAATNEERPAWPFEVFLRLPKGYGAATDKKPTQENVPFFRFNGPEQDY